MVLPVLTGTGRRLTPQIATDAALSHLGARTWPHGVVELTYAVS